MISSILRGSFRDRALTIQWCRLSSELAVLDALIEAASYGVESAKSSVPIGSGRTTAAARFVAAATRAGEIVVWVKRAIRAGHASGR
jgi:hypothetical protein